MVSRASSQLILRHFPSPLPPALCTGYRKRRGWFKYSREAAPLAQMAPRLTGSSGSPATLTGRLFSRCISTPHPWPHISHVLFTFVLFDISSDASNNPASRMGIYVEKDKREKH